jgi:hypothetical protein
MAWRAWPRWQRHKGRGAAGLKDGNEDPIPDSLRGIPLLGDGDGTSFFPTENYMEGNPSPSGLTGVGMVICPPSPFPAPICYVLARPKTFDMLAAHKRPNARGEYILQV